MKTLYQYHKRISTFQHKRERRIKRTLQTRKATKARVIIASFLLVIFGANILIDKLKAAQDDLGGVKPHWSIVRAAEVSVDAREATGDVPIEEPEPVLDTGVEAETTGGLGSQDTIQPSLEDKIREMFPEGKEKALKIMQCESKGNPEQVGDKNLAFTHNGQEYGKSIGLFQIRTGGKERGKVWVRSENVKEFEKEMMIPEKNIEMAVKISSGGKDWLPWRNCAKLIGII